MEHLLLILAIIVLGYGLVSAVVPKTLLTLPIVLVVVGMVLSQTLGPGETSPGREALMLVAELTLVILLFTDATRIDGGSLLREFGLPLRLLGVGLPLTILAGFLLGRWLFPEFGIWEAALLAAILAPTDAALGQAVVSSPRVPAKIRQALNVESGLNDGIAVPVVTLFAALAAIQAGDVAGETTAVNGTAYWVTLVSRQLILGPLAGIFVGVLGGRAIEVAARRRWVDENFRQLAGISLAVIAWAGAASIGGNGFIAAFCCGLAMGAATRFVKPAIQEFGETEGLLLSVVAFVLFGALFVIPAVSTATSVQWCYAFGSLTIVRMLPVAIASIGTRVQPITVVFLGWFGPRGLASLIFALLVTEGHVFAHGETLFTTAILTVTVSIFAHGLTAVPGAYGYAARVNAHVCRPGCEHEAVTEHPLRHSVAPVAAAPQHAHNPETT